MGYKHCKSTILDQGTELLRQKGYHNVGIQEILQVCGIPKGSFYNFFKSKEDFVAQCLRHYGAESTKLLEAYLRNGTHPPLDRLRRFYRTMADRFSREGCTAGCLLANLSMEVGGTNLYLAAVADEILQQHNTLITACIQEAQQMGSMTNTFPATHLAEYLQAGMAGAMSRMKVQHNRRFLDQWYTMTFTLLKAN